MGLVEGVGRAFGLIDESRLTEDTLALMLRYGRAPTPGKLRKGCDQIMQPVAKGDLGPGDIVLMAWRRYPQHMGIVATVNGRLTLIHCYEKEGRCVEHGLTTEWDDRIVRCYKYHGVDY